MKRFPAFVLIAAFGAFTIGCESKKGTTEDKTETTITQTKDGETTGESKVTTTDTTKSTPPVAPGTVGETTERKTETTTETTK